MMIKPTPLSGLFEIETLKKSDERGNFSRLFCENELSEVFGKRKIVQANHSFTKKCGTVRGMHFQEPPAAEMKMVRCLRGKVWDVSVDLRRDSNTFLKWHSIELSAENSKAVVIPEGFAHGFQTLSDDCELLYFHSHKYEPSLERGLRWDDPSLNIQWPIKIIDLSMRDQSYGFVRDIHFTGLNT